MRQQGKWIGDEVEMIMKNWRRNTSKSWNDDDVDDEDGDGDDGDVDENMKCVIGKDLHSKECGNKENELVMIIMAITMTLKWSWKGDMMTKR